MPTNPETPCRTNLIWEPCRSNGIFPATDLASLHHCDSSISRRQVDYISGGDMIGGQTSPLLQAFPELPQNVTALLGNISEIAKSLFRSRQDSNLRSQRETDF